MKKQTVMSQERQKISISNNLENDDDTNKFNYWYYKSKDNDNKVHYINQNLNSALEFYKKSANQGCLDTQYKIIKKKYS